MDSHSILQDLTLNTFTQDTLSGQRYDMMLRLVRVQLPITQVNFIKVWKTLLLKCVEDVYYKETGVHPGRFLHCASTIPVSTPLDDLLYNKHSGPMADCKKFYRYSSNKLKKSSPKMRIEDLYHFQQDNDPKHTALIMREW